VTAIRVLLADDQPLVRDGLRAILEAQGDVEVVGEASSGREAIELAFRHVVDVILMDIRMPNVDGIAACREIASRPRAPRVVIVTTHELDEYIYDGLRAGASGFLLSRMRRASSSLRAYALPTRATRSWRPRSRAASSRPSSAARHPSPGRHRRYRTSPSASSRSYG
jgi:DNA-binding NarL/FixJ family response regulator